LLHREALTTAVALQEPMHSTMLAVLPGTLSHFLPDIPGRSLSVVVFDGAVGVPVLGCGGG
jgi:hypothetical protein